MRTSCHKCFRPITRCYCVDLSPIDTSTKFIILMHPKERKKRIATGRMSWLNLKNSELWLGLDFNEKIKGVPGRKYVLYPSDSAVPIESISREESGDGQTTLFILDGTWGQAFSLLKENPELERLPHVSFSNVQTSNFIVKKQPRSHCLATIESIHTYLSILEKDTLSSEALRSFLKPFEKMVQHQAQFGSISERLHK